jgi:uncharacterized protein (DUF488 family)
MTQSATLLTIGHSNLSADRFMALLTSAGVTAVADVRSIPFSRWCPWFSAKAKLYRNDVADYEAMAARPEFVAGLERVADEIARHRVCLLCAEREPLDCHRCLLVGRALAEGGLRLGHIRVDGTIEPHAGTEDRLLALAGDEADLFRGRAERLAHAYRRRAQAVAARFKT